MCNYDDDDDDNDDDNEEKQDSWQELLAGKMLKTRTVLLSGEIRKGLAEKTIRQLLLMEATGDEPVKIFIDSSYSASYFRSYLLIISKYTLSFSWKILNFV